jgi:hypothetical protein
MTTQEIYLVLDNIVQTAQTERDVKSNLHTFGMTLGKENIRISDIPVQEHLQKRTFKEAFHSFIQGYIVGMFVLLDVQAKKRGSNVNDLIGMLAAC